MITEPARSAPEGYNPKGFTIDLTKIKDIAGPVGQGGSSYLKNARISTTGNIPYSCPEGNIFSIKVDHKDARGNIIKESVIPITNCKKVTPTLTTLPIVTQSTTIPTINNPAVTIYAAGDQNYNAGEDIKLFGTNSVTNKVYLFITGTNIPFNGGSIKAYDPRLNGNMVISGQEKNFQVIDVQSDKTWSWTWETSKSTLEDGTYLLYAVSAPKSKIDISDATYGTAVIMIRAESTIPLSTSSPNTGIPTDVPTILPTTMIKPIQKTDFNVSSTIQLTITPTNNIEKLLIEQNKKIDEQNKLIAEQNKKITEQSDLLSQILNYFKGFFK